MCECLQKCVYKSEHVPYTSVKNLIFEFFVNNFLFFCLLLNVTYIYSIYIHVLLMCKGQHLKIIGKTFRGL